MRRLRNSVVRYSEWHLQQLRAMQRTLLFILLGALRLITRIARTPSSDDIGGLENYYRELTRLAQEEKQMLTEEPADVVRNVEILAALRRASESNAQRIVPQPSKMRKLKGPRADMDSMDSPGPSPGLASSATRFKGSSARSGSAPSSRDGKDSIFNFDDGVDGAKGSSAERAGKFVVGAEVAYKQARPKEDGGQWIQCSIISVTEIGNKKRYHPGLSQVFLSNIPIQL